MALKLKIVSSMEKCFLDDTMESKAEILSLSMLKNERLSFQLIYTADDSDCIPRALGKFTVDSSISEHITLSSIRSVPVHMPIYQGRCDDNYLRTAPGLYPDLLIPISFGEPICVVNGQLNSSLVTIECQDGIAAGRYDIVFSLTVGEAVKTSNITVNVIDAELPKQSLIHTQWFHNDCLATYYGCEMFSDRHFEIIASFMEGAHRCGVNTILVPVLTPPLDTAVGGERLTAQLVDVTLINGEYEFSFDKLDRYIGIAKAKGMEYFEISHLFSQWGAKFAPKVMAKVIEGDKCEYKRIFGWESEAAGEEYTHFIRKFTAALLLHLKQCGIDKRCFFHISDEPRLEHFDSYRKAKSAVADLLGGYKIIDALSDYEFYKSGACENPVVSNDHIAPFIENKVPNLWTYYCCIQGRDVSNRFIAMPGERTRIIGVQLFNYDIKGFLHWGYNFWYSDDSRYAVDPFSDTCGDNSFPGGDAFGVYPGADGKPLYSLRSVLLYEAFQDMRALELLSAVYGRERAISLISEKCGSAITFSSYPHSGEYIISLRESVNKLIEARIL